jgi:hypothetical protein
MCSNTPGWRCRPSRADNLVARGAPLAIVRRIADMHDGAVEAITLPQGVKFRLRVPEIVGDPPAAELPR